MKIRSSCRRDTQTCWAISSVVSGSLDVGFHQQHRLGELWMTGAKAVLQRDALTLATLANALDHQFFRHRTGQFRAVIAGQHRQQQVEYRHAAASAQAIAIPVKQMAGGDDLGEALGEIVLPAPMHGGTVTVEQPQLGQGIDTGRQTADHTTGTHQLLEGAAQG